MVVNGLVHKVEDNEHYILRLKDASLRIQERATALAERMDNAPENSAVREIAGDNYLEEGSVLEKDSTP